MSLTWRDSLSVRRCASIAAAIIEKVQYAHNWYNNLLHYYTKDNTIDKWIYLFSFHTSTLSFFLYLFLPLLSSPLPSPTPSSHSPSPPPSPSPSPSYRLHLKKTCTSNYWSKFYWLVHSVYHSLYVWASLCWFLVLIAVLQSLQIHGADESIKPLLLGLALQLYEVMVSVDQLQFSLFGDLSM